jgi:hypothetical protein
MTIANGTRLRVAFTFGLAAGAILAGPAASATRRADEYRQVASIQPAAGIEVVAPGTRMGSARFISAPRARERVSGVPADQRVGHSLRSCW